MIDKLPKKLLKEPLIDAIFEMRFSSSDHVSEILPGFLFGKLEGKKSIVNLPASQIPKPLRDTDPNLKFSPLTRLNWGNYTINIGDNSISVGCNYPYQGWVQFKDHIIKVISAIKDIEVLECVNRYSMKYIDLIPSNNIKNQISLINMDLSIAGHKIEQENFNIRVEINREEFANIITIVPSATAKLIDGTERQGIIIDIDTIKEFKNKYIHDIINEEFSKKLDSIHIANKAMFFDCLRQETIEKLEPIYDE